jgi:hypothetical protein
MYAVPRQTAILPYKIGRALTSQKCILEDVAREDVVVVSRKQVERRRAPRPDPPALSLSSSSTTVLPNLPHTTGYRLSQ